jgi:hypothetical protein
MIRINLREYIEKDGFALDEGESTENSLKIRRDNEVLIVRENDNGEWGYFTPHDSGDKGNIVQYLQGRRGAGFTLGHCKKHMREYAGGVFRGPMVPGMPRPVFQKTLDLSHVARRWETLNSVWGLPHYLEGRGLALETIKAYASALRMDKKGNVLFAHTNDDGQVVGYEIKGHDFDGFAKGGVRTLCRMGPLDGGVPAKIALTESGIDALSLAQLVGRRDALYCSTGGALGPHTLNAIKALAAKHPEAEILLAFDADMAGDGYAVNIEKALGARDSVRRLMPKIKDWNDQLQLKLGMRKPEP